ncbi:MAG: hypothetical protein AAF990_21975 [Bacteroidota bacterium]
MKTFLSLSCVLFLFLACNNSSSTESSSTSQSSISPSEQLELDKLEIELDSDVDELRYMSNNIQIQGRQLLPEENFFLEAADVIITRYTSWKEAWEAPGISVAQKRILKDSLLILLDDADEVIDLIDEQPQELE